MSKTAKICCDSLDDVVISIALEQTAIAHILNAEGKKIQKGIALAKCVDELLCLNKSVQNTIADVTNLEIVLYNKLKNALSCGSCGCGCGSEGCDCGSEDCEKGKICVCVSMCCSKELFKNAIVQLYCGNQTKLMDNGRTDCNGQFCFNELENGEYDLVVINPMTGEKIVTRICIDKNQKNCNKKICFENTTLRKIKISGKVVDSNGNCLSRALVIAKGLIEKRTQTDNLGNFEIKELDVADTFNIFATYGGKKSNVSNRAHLAPQDDFYSVKIIII